MTKIESRIPDALFAQAKQLAERENISLDQLVTIALTAQVSAWMTRGHLETRAARGDWQRAREVLAKAPDTQPPARDALD
ncbi:MAG: hypothetical protein H0U81_03700 [Pyrinomonadaceae bacterium]|nr:hypothetical protein [Pyrinomonadaceae bacterium]